MALLPKSHHRKTRLFAPSRPNYNDFSGPPDGDYVRYVEDLMAWAEHEQQRQRLRALGEKSVAQQPSAQEWGRSPVKPALKPATKTTATSQLPAEQLAAQLSAVLDRQMLRWSPKFSWMLLIPILILTGVFVPDWLPFVIMAWVALNVFLSIRSAGRKKS